MGELVEFPNGGVPSGLALYQQLSQAALTPDSGDTMQTAGEGRPALENVLRLYHAHHRHHHGQADSRADSRADPQADPRADPPDVTAYAHAMDAIALSHAYKSATSDAEALRVRHKHLQGLIVRQARVLESLRASHMYFLQTLQDKDFMSLGKDSEEGEQGPEVGQERDPSSRRPSDGFVASVSYVSDVFGAYVQGAQSIAQTAQSRIKTELEGMDALIEARDAEASAVRTVLVTAFREVLNGRINSGSGSAAGSEEQMSKHTCPVCWDAECDMCAVPCGHTLCGKCVKKMEVAGAASASEGIGRFYSNSAHKCGICRGTVSSFVKLFYAS
jgi:hypothetical protein